MTEIVAAFPDVQIAVADARGLHLDQDLRSRWLGRRLIHFLQGRIEIGNLKTLHRCSPVGAFCAKVETGSAKEYAPCLEHFGAAE
jgi:hypothetical protein